MKNRVPFAAVLVLVLLSAFVSVAPAGAAPGAPFIVSATPGINSMTLAFTASASSATTDTNTYSVSDGFVGSSPYACSLSARTVSAGLTSGTMLCTGLSTIGLLYRFVMTSTDTQGVVSPQSNVVQGSPITAPQAPGAVFAPADSSVGITITPPQYDGGAPVTGYSVTTVPAAGNCVNLATVSLTVSCTGLANGTQYRIAVAGVNAAGTGFAITGFITPRTLPGSVTGLTAQGFNSHNVLGTGEVSLSWAAPVNNGGAAVIGYTITTAPAAGSCQGITVTVPSALCSGLPVGQPFTFTVSAVNAAGAGPLSVIVAGPPGVAPAVRSLVATPGVGSVILSWSPPTYDGGTPITGYRVVGGSPFFSSCGSGATTSALTIRCTGLFVAGGETFSVAAVNVEGWGAESLVLGTVIDPVSGLSAAPGDGSVRLSWATPGNAGTEVSGYRVTTSPAVGGCISLSVAAPSATCSGLVNGTSYTFSVVAVDAAGRTTSGASVAAIPRTVPGVPTGLAALAGNGSVSLNWGISTTGGSVITGYRITTSPAVGTCNGITVTTSSATCTGLTNGTAYAFTVAAINAAGSGAATAPLSATPRTVPTAPVALTATPGNGSLTLSWSAPTSNGGSAITQYNVSGSPVPSCGAIVAVTTFTCSGLANGVTYTFTVAGQNAAGQGALATVAATPRTVPGTPTGLVASPGNTLTSLTWNAPASNGGAVITGYRVTTSPAAGTCNGATVATTSVTCTGLVNGTTYSFTVAAVNVAGTGVATLGVSTIPRTVPSSPVLTATPGNALVNLSWTVPANGGSAITGYRVSTTPAVASCNSIVVTTTTASCTGLVNGTTYAFSVAAVNAAGAGVASVQSVTAGVPTSPTGLTAAFAVGSTTVSWTASNGNGVAILRYEYCIFTGVVVIGVGDCPATSTSWVSVATATRVTVKATRGSVYTIRVRAVNSRGASRPSSLTYTQTL